MALRITYDPTVRAAYIHLDDELILTTRRFDRDVLLNLTADARVVGIELLDVDPPVVECYGMPPGAGPAGEGE